MEDVPMLAEHFLQIYADKYKRKNVRFSENAYDQMLNYNWRGNVRELQHAIERAILLSKSGTIESLDIPRTSDSPVPMAQLAAAQAQAGVVRTAAPANGPAVASVAVSTPAAPQIETLDDIGRLIVSKIPEPEDGTEQKDIFNELESTVVLAALKRTKGNKQAAAQLLGLYRPRLYGMIKRHNLEEKL
jgi:DNA-binding NtrC family response regulator